MADKEMIERWARYIIPAVFKAETKILQEHPEWKERLKNIKEEDAQQVAEEYCRAIAEEIINNSVDADGESECVNV